MASSSSPHVFTQNGEWNRVIHPSPSLGTRKRKQKKGWCNELLGFIINSLGVPKNWVFEKKKKKKKKRDWNDSSENKKDQITSPFWDAYGFSQPQFGFKRIKNVYINLLPPFPTRWSHTVKAYLGASRPIWCVEFVYMGILAFCFYSGKEFPGKRKMYRKFKQIL